MKNNFPSTENCVVCFKDANGGFGGHVHKEDESIIAGFCDEHFRNTDEKVEGCKGCYGKWKEEMGIDETFGQMMYIDRDGIHPVDDEDDEDE